MRIAMQKVGTSQLSYTVPQALDGAILTSIQAIVDVAVTGVMRAALSDSDGALVMLSQTTAALPAGNDYRVLWGAGAGSFTSATASLSASVGLPERVRVEQGDTIVVTNMSGTITVDTGVLVLDESSAGLVI